MNTFFLIFIGIPAIEIFLLIKIGGEIGALSTIALIFLTAIIGIFYARIQGIQTLRAGLINIYQNKTPQKRTDTLAWMQREREREREREGEREIERETGHRVHFNFTVKVQFLFLTSVRVRLSHARRRT